MDSKNKAFQYKYQWDHQSTEWRKSLAENSFACKLLFLMCLKQEEYWPAMQLSEVITICKFWQGGIYKAHAATTQLTQA